MNIEDSSSGSAKIDQDGTMNYISVQESETMNGKTQTTQNLEQLLLDIDKWAIQKLGKRYNPLSPALKDYPNWKAISVAFVESLQTLSLEESTLTMDLLGKAVHLDWAHHKLLAGVPEETVKMLLTRPYPSEEVRLYMLGEAKRLRDAPLVKEILMRFLESDSSDTIRDEALLGLAHLKWERTDHFAAIWWQSQETVKQIVTLQALQLAGSASLTSYLEAAKNSKDKSVQAAASAIEAISDLEG